MRKIFVLSLIVLLPSCTENGGGITIDDEGTVAGVAYIDRDGDGQLGTGDGPAVGVLAALLLDATGDTVARATSRANGTFIMQRIAAGRYRLVASRGTAGDTVDVLQIDSAQISLAARDTIARSIRLGYPRTSVAAARALASGRRITVEGIALNPWAAFGDSTVHISDATGALRGVRVAPSNLQAGDSVSFVGTTGVVNGRVVLADVTARVVGVARGLPPADSLSTQRASTADNGRLGDAQVRVAGALVRDTSSLGNFRRVGIDDGSGRLEVLMNRNIAFPVESHAPGATVNMTGVLVPSATGSTWQLKPRSPADVTGTFPVVTVAQARTLPVGSRVYIDGIALNGWAVFGDSTMHIADRTGAIRAVRALPSTAIAGDSVQVLGTTGLTDGRLSLVDVQVRIVAFARGLPPLDAITTGAAATAANGARADGQVRIASATIRDTATVNGDLVLGIDDGSGRVEVVLDRSIVFNPGPYVPGGTFVGAGVLVPSPTSASWRLKPRNANEATITFATVTVAQARSLADGQSVVLQGRALNGWTAFGDSTVHVRDATGSMRATRVVGNVAGGDSIRIVGVMATQNGQKIVTNAVASIVVAGVGLPVADSISTARSNTADNGTRDAAQVRVAGTIIGVEGQLNGDLILTVDDGSGRAEVLFDKDIAFTPAPYLPGAILTAAGVLVPKGDGTWQLKPRTATDVTATHPVVTVAQARALPAGKTVTVRGVALNGWVTFGDASVHIRDATGSIRVVNLPTATVFAGDSVRIVGTVAISNGQPVLIGIGTNVLLAGVGVGTPPVVSTLVASNASGGTLDAAQVDVTGTISTVALDQNGDLLLTISDGTGTLVVRLDKDVGFAFGAYNMGANIRARGVLVPAVTGTSWELKPRAPNEVTIIT